SRMTLRPEPYEQFTNDTTYRMIDELAQLAAARNLSLLTMALAWVVTDPGVTAAIVGPRRPDQLAAMCAATDVELTAVDRATLGAVTTAGA
ncbi:MAG TPA: aldo/keto reductase, partial [Micromonosporaceae bacterium]|nr:aldo/keto reductase [Micromonosporaceae bacterium]